MAYFARAHSTPVKIARPPSKEPEATRSPASAQGRKDSVQRQCRNIVIYGHCKYQDKGCLYYHPSAPESPTPSSAPLPSVGGARPQSPVITGALSAHAVNAPVFVPKATSAFSALSNSASPPPVTAEPRIGDSNDYDYQQEEDAYQDYSLTDGQTGYDDYQHYQDDTGVDMDSMTQQIDQLNAQYYDRHYPTEYNGATAAAYFGASAAPVFVRQPLNYHLYTPTAYPDLRQSTTSSHFVPPSSELRHIMQERSETIRGIAPPGTKVPEELQGYHTLVPLEPTGPGVERRKFGSWYSTVYRAIKASDGLPYILRRIENYRLMNQSAFASIDFWSTLNHPGIVCLKEAFTTRSFDDSSLVVVYAYHPNAKTLYETYLKDSQQLSSTASPPSASAPTFVPGQRSARFQSFVPQQSSVVIGQSPVIPERTIWSYIVQLATAIKRVHESGHAIRGLDSTKVIITSQNRIRISTCGTMDVLMHDTPADLHLMQQDDLSQFGRLIFAICCGNTGASSGPHFQKSIDHLMRVYGQEIKSLALWLISKQTIKTIDHVLESIKHRVLQEQEDAFHAVDRLETELQGELENARLFRLVTKLGFINERPEFAREPRWSETGDRYIIKLFRDYVFHQVDEHSNPVLDMSHVLTCLNKLDAGADERIMLVARDEQSCLVVSYKEIKNCIEAAYGDLVKAAIASPAAYKHR
ncbi:hypothetical protein FA15DRAFT_669061 [Coprinopsis marcescibilis]|uniref:PAN2-PAN3 deadenylation complex subunit PAN3 n=1 Tax=Coprinopsis marcescibilis TaxID=230819 RepID=A0A5C3L9F5_COPMA|nr:hypothetical protein FA15DRAFT_669061 [Coprinopsis marcescibilis]